MNKLVFLLFLSIFGCIRLERLEERDKVFSYDDFRKLVKKEDIAEYLSKNEYDLKQELEQVRDILHILIQNDMEAEVLALLDKLNALKEEERVKFLSIGDEKEALFLVIDKLWVKSAMKILDMYSKEVKQVKLGFGQRLNFNLLGRAVMNKNIHLLLFVLDLRRKYAKEIEDEYARSCTFKINKKLSKSLEKAYDLVAVRKADKASEVDKSIGEDSIFVTFLKECLKKKGIKGEVSIEEFLSNLDEEGKKEALTISNCLGDERVLSYLLNLGVKQDEVDENGNTALIYSSYYGREEVSKILIEKGVSIDLAAKNGETPLYLASSEGHKEVVELLLIKGASIDLANKNGETSLFAASCNGHKEVVELLLTKGAAIDLAMNDRATPLFIASQRGHKEVVELLLMKGAAIDLAMNDRSTPLFIASYNGKKEIVELLIKNGAAIDLRNNNGATPLYTASFWGHKEIIEFLLSNGAKVDLVDQQGRTPLYIASQFGRKEIVELLLAKCAAVNLVDQYGSMPLLIASERGHKEVVELLINKGAAINLGNKNGSTPLWAASGEGHKEVVELLLEKGAVIDLATCDERTPLYISSQNGHKAVVELLMTKGASINLAEKFFGVTPLSAASHNGHKEVVELLIENGAAIDLGNKDGETPLYRASQFGRKEVVEMLITKGAAIDLADKFGRTPLLIASQKGEKEVVKLLINKGASIDLREQDGITPLYIASQRGHKEVVELLLAKCPTIDLAKSDGITPLWIASQEGHKRIVELLINKGADVNKVNLKGKSVLEAALLNEKEEVIEELLSSCFVEGKGIVLSSISLVVNEATLNLFNRGITQKGRSSILSFARVYRILNEVYSKQFIKEVERDLDKSCTTKLVEIMDEIKTLTKLNEREVKEANIEVDAFERFKYETIDNLNKMFNKRSDLKATSVYDKFKNNQEVILNRRVKAGYYKNYTILMLEILKGDLDKVLDKVKELIKEGSDVNAANQSGDTCLALAIRKNLKEVVEELINNGADINTINNSGENALMIAVEGNLVDMVKRLAPLTKIDHEDIFTNTALMLAIKKIMRINPNFSNLEKRFNDMEEIIDILIKSGAKVTEEVIELLKDKKENEVLEKFCLKLARIFKFER